MNLSHPLTQSRRRGIAVLAALPLLAVLVSGCAPEPADSAQQSTPATVTPADQTDDVEEELVVQEPRVQEETCGWDAGSLSTSLPGSMPSGQQGDIATAIVGAWQHTHFDSGSGYEALDSEDIRYIFPSSERLLYCQHVPGITEHASNATDFTWDGTAIVLPGGAPGFTVTDWNDSVMVWTNNMDGSTYLLQRR